MQYSHLHRGFQSPLPLLSFVFLFVFFGLQHSKYWTLSSLCHNREAYAPVVECFQGFRRLASRLNKTTKEKSVKETILLQHWTVSKHLQEDVVLGEATWSLVISCCALLLFWHKSLYKFHSSAGTTSCPDRGSSPGSRDSTPSTGPPCICRWEQLRPGRVGEGVGREWVSRLTIFFTNACLNYETETSVCPQLYLKPL